MFIALDLKFKFHVETVSRMRAVFMNQSYLAHLIENVIYMSGFLVKIAGVYVVRFIKNLVEIECFAFLW